MASPRRPLGLLVEAGSAWLGCRLRGVTSSRVRVQQARARPAPHAVTAADGTTVADLEPNLTLYDYEASPWCRRVREAAQELDLDLLILPCPRETVLAEGVYSSQSRHRGAAAAAGGGRVLFPLLVDGTAGAHVHQSGEIIAHLQRQYGAADARPAAAAAAPGLLATARLMAPSTCRPHRGVMRWPSRIPQPMQPLQLWAQEGCWRCALAREALSELEIPYVLRPVGAGGGWSQHRGLAPADGGLPRLFDPNAGRSGEIAVGYRSILTRLEARYADAAQQGEGGAALSSRPGLRALLSPIPADRMSEPAVAEWWIAGALQRLGRAVDWRSSKCNSSAAPKQ